MTTNDDVLSIKSSYIDIIKQRLPKDISDYIISIYNSRRCKNNFIKTLKVINYIGILINQDPLVNSVEVLKRCIVPNDPIYICKYCSCIWSNFTHTNTFYIEFDMKQNPNNCCKKHNFFIQKCIIY